MDDDQIEEAFVEVMAAFARETDGWSDADESRLACKLLKHFDMVWGDDESEDDDDE